MPRWCSNATAMCGEQGSSSSRWDVEGSPACLCPGPTTHLPSRRPAGEGAIKSVTMAAEMASRMLWIRRREPWLR